MTHDGLLPWYHLRAHKSPHLPEQARERIRQLLRDASSRPVIIGDADEESLRESSVENEDRGLAQIISNIMHSHTLRALHHKHNNQPKNNPPPSTTIPFQYGVDRNVLFDYLHFAANDTPCRDITICCKFHFALHSHLHRLGTFYCHPSSLDGHCNTITIGDH
jgi:hypothetical protein